MNATMGRHLAILIVILATAAASGSEMRFAPLVPLGITPSSETVFNISDDGLSIVGLSHRWAVKWNLNGAVTALGEASTQHAEIAHDVSSDGSVVVGVRLGDGNSPDQLFRWTELTGTTILAPVATGPVSVSGDGQLVVGHLYDSRRRARMEPAFVLSVESNDLIVLEPFEGGDFTAAELSSDGATLVGGVYPKTGSRDRIAIGWTERDGIFRIGVPDGYGEAHAVSVSSDGSIVAGTAADSEAFLWSAEGGFRLVGERSRARKLSADGTTLVGDAPSYGAFVWNEQHGMRSIASILEEAGVDLTGWQLYAADAVSGDGRVIAGRGRLNEDPRRRLWVAEIPEPSSAALIVFGIVLVARCRGLNTWPFT